MATKTLMRKTAIQLSWQLIAVWKELSSCIQQRHHFKLDHIENVFCSMLLVLVVGYYLPQAAQTVGPHCEHATKHAINVCGPESDPIRSNQFQISPRSPMPISKVEVEGFLHQKQSVSNFTSSLRCRFSGWRSRAFSSMSNQFQSSPPSLMLIFRVEV